MAPAERPADAVAAPASAVPAADADDDRAPQARLLARSAPSLDELRGTAAALRGLRPEAPRPRSLVFADGNPQAG